MIQKVEKNYIFEKELNSILLCGDPGCDGYNTKAIVVFEEILNMPSDFTMVLGDMVPIGNNTFFNQFIDIVNSNAKSPVFCLVGNHDILEYENFFGKKNYYIEFLNGLFIILDNSKRYFTDETLSFLDETLKNNQNENTFVLFHIPPPNPFIQNNFSDNEWKKLTNILDNYKNNIKMLFCGHIHSAFDYNLDGYRVIATGGAGSRLDPVDNNCLRNNNHHTFKLVYNNGKWTPKIIDIPYNAVKTIYNNNINFDNEITNELINSFIGEAQGYIKYVLYSKVAKNNGQNGLAKLFKALSESEFIHSKNMLIASNKINDSYQNILNSMEREKYESDDLYPSNMEKTNNHNLKRGYNAYHCALEAEKVHYKILKKALDELKNSEDITDDNYYICTRCGYMFKGNKNSIRICPACGTDVFKFKEIT